MRCEGKCKMADLIKLLLSNLLKLKGFGFFSPALHFSGLIYYICCQPVFRSKESFALHEELLAFLSS